MRRSLTFEGDVQRRLDNLTLEWQRLNHLFDGGEYYPEFALAMDNLHRALSQVDAFVEGYFIKQNSPDTASRLAKSGDLRLQTRGGQPKSTPERDAKK